MPAAGTLNFVFKDLKLTNDNFVFRLDDLLSVGPLFKIETSKGIEERKSYTEKLIKKVDPDYPLSEDVNIIDLLNFNFSKFDEVIIWHSENAPEKILKLLCCELVDKCKLFEIDIFKAKDINGNIPWSIGECDPETIKNLLNTIIKISDNEYLKCKQKWERLTVSEEKLRIYENGLIINVLETYYDHYIIEQCTDEYISAINVVGRVLRKSNQLISDTFIMYRLFRLIENKDVEYTGNISDFRQMIIKLK